MSAFKVGDRVRLVGGDRHEMTGAEGVIVRATTPGEGWMRSDWVVEFPAHTHATPSELPPTHWGCPSRILAPLTPPQADSWAADKVRQLTKFYTEPVRVKERV